TGTWRTPTSDVPPMGTVNRLAVTAEGARSGPDEMEEPAGLPGEPVHRFLGGQALDLGHLFRHPRGHPRTRGRALELALVRPRGIAPAGGRAGGGGLDPPP